MSQDTKSTKKAVAAMEVTTTDPDFIVYLLDPEQEYNCYFVVGNPSFGNIEKIGVVKKMLLAHSPVLRAELLESKIAEKNDVEVIDLFPQTFKNLLRFVYGYDNTHNLSFDEADNLLYAADKYMMPKLKNILVTKLMTMLNPSNICSLMNNPVCYTVLELNSAISEILQLETDKVLSNPQFVDISSLGLLTILEQKSSSVPEVELWRAAIEWAKEKGKSVNGEVLRNELTDHLKLIRFCSMTSNDMLREVIPTKVLSYDEIIAVGESQRTGKVQRNLTTICNVIEKRGIPIVKSKLLCQSLSDNAIDFGSATESTFQLKTKDVAIELCSFKLYNRNMSAHHCNCTVSIQRGVEPPVVVRNEGRVDDASNWTIPILVDEKNVLLSPNSSYSITFTSCPNNDYAMYKGSPYGQTGSHFSVDFLQHSSGYYIFHVSEVFYKTLTKRVRSAQTGQ